MSPAVQPRAADAPPEPPALATRNFVLLCATNLLSYVDNFIITPVLPLFLASQGFSAGFIGLVLAAFNVSSFSSRPLFGRWVDAGHARSSLVGSTAVLAVTAFGYLAPGTLVLVLLRVAHGLGWAGMNTVSTAWMAMVVPLARRGEGMGYYLISQSVGSALAPAVGVWLFTTQGANAAFAVAGLAAAGATLAAWLTTNPSRAVPPPAAGAGPTAAGPWWARVFEPSVFAAMAILALTQVNQVLINAYVPLYFQGIGVGGVEWFFVVLGVMTVVSGTVAGRLADRVGRVAAIYAGLGTQCVGLLLLWQGRELTWLAAGAGLYALGNGACGTALYALAADRAPADRRGAAMATYTMGYQLGAGVGAVVWGFTIEKLGFEPLYALALLPLLAAAALTLARSRA